MLKTFVGESQSLLQSVNPERAALVVDETTVTFGELRERIAFYRRALNAMGIGVGAKVAVCFPNSAELLYLAFAAMDLGACLVPVHPSTPRPFLARMLGFLEVNILLVPNDFPMPHPFDLPCDVVSVGDLERRGEGAAEPTLPTPDPESTAVIISTSGTLAEPKFVPICQENFATIIDATRAMLEPMEDFETGLSYILMFPLSSSGILPTMAQIALGSTYVLTDDVSLPHFLTLIERYRLDGMQCPPAYLEALVRFSAFERYDVSSITRLNSGSDFVPAKTLTSLKNRFANLRHIGIGYGLAETSAIVMSWSAHDPSEFGQPTNRYRMIGTSYNEVGVFDTSGRPCEVGEKGEVWIRGKSVIKGYYRNPELTASTFDENGWMHTGDVGTLEADGALQLLGRTKHTIKRGGRSISPVTVSSALEEHPAVEKAVAVGVPHPLYGEMLWAFVRTSPDKTVTEGEINAFCRETLPSYYKPDSIVFLEEVPKTRVGKDDYVALREIGLMKLQEMIGVGDE